MASLFCKYAYFLIASTYGSQHNQQTQKNYAKGLTHRNTLFILHRNILMDVSPPNSSFGGYWPRLPASAFFWLFTQAPEQT